MMLTSAVVVTGGTKFGMITALEKFAADSPTTLASPSPSRTWRCQSSGATTFNSWLFPCWALLDSPILCRYPLYPDKMLPPNDLPPKDIPEHPIPKDCTFFVLAGLPWPVHLGRDLPAVEIWPSVQVTLVKCKYLPSTSSIKNTSNLPMQLACGLSHIKPVPNPISGSYTRNSQ